MTSSAYGRYRSALGSVFPEVGVGGFTRVDGTVEFYQRVNALIGIESVVVNLGAGRGKYFDDDVRVRRDLQNLKGRVKEVTGLDVDAAVYENQGLDRSLVIDPDGAYPLADEYADVVLSDWTFEHIKNPSLAASEIDRVLKPGGWVCARTPNKWSLVGASTRAVPNRLHDAVLKRVQPHKQDRDTFPTSYRMNTLGALRGLFPVPGYEHFTYHYQSESAYTANSAPLLGALFSMQRRLPTAAQDTLMIFMKKNAGNHS